MPTHALIFYTHYASKTLQHELGRIQRGLDSNFKIFAVGCCESRHALDELASETVRVKAYVRDDLRALPYPRQLQNVNWKTLRGNSDLALLRFFRDAPIFDFYWIIEYDVRFTGKWSALLHELLNSPADLLCSYVTRRTNFPEWYHWAGFASAEETISDTELLRAFLPFCRVSRTLMRAIDERCARGWTGHPEVLWPTTAASLGLSIEEIGGNSAHVPPHRLGKYYSSSARSGVFLSTFGAWPYYSDKSNFYDKSPPDLLWHPVKE